MRHSFTDLRSMRHGVLLLLCLWAWGVAAQNSQFGFDLAGNLTTQTAEIFGLPKIVRQPQTKLAGPGESASYFVVAADATGLDYQWQFNGATISGATADTLLLTNINSTNEGSYTVVLHNISGTVTSASAMLYIDSDRDGLPDSWEMTYFGNLNQTATGDFDGDGVSNLQEFLDGTNPANSASALYRLFISSDGGTINLAPNQDTYTNGSTVVLIAVPTAPDTFHFWTGDMITNSNPLTVTMTNNKTLFAHFKPVDFTWINPSGGDWNTPANWNVNFVPGTNDNVILNDGANITLNTPAACFGFTLANGTILNGSGNLTIYGNATWSSGFMEGGGRTILETGSSMTLNNSVAVQLNTRLLENGGTITCVGSGPLTFISSFITNRAGALFDVQSATSLSWVGGATSHFDNAGTIHKSVNAGTLTFQSNVNLNNYGDIEIEPGTFVINSTLLNTGSINLSPGTTTQIFAGSSSGSISNPASSLVEWPSSAFTLNTGAQLNGAGIYRIDGSATVYCNADVTIEKLDLSSGLNGTGKVTINNTLNWTNGSMQGGGSTIIAPGATANILSGAALTLSSRILENAGTAIWAGPNVIYMQGAVITNRAGALFDDQTSTGFTWNGGATARFDNVGMFLKSTSGVTTFSSGVDLNNYGDIEIAPGTFVINSSLLNSGTINLSSGTTMQIFGGSSSGLISNPPSSLVEWPSSIFTLNPGAQLNGAGIYRIDGGGSVNCNTGLTIQNLDLSSSLGGTGTVTINNTLNWTNGSMQGGGSTIIAPGATANILSAAALTLSSRILENAGTAIWTGPNPINLQGAVITNRFGALFDDQTSSTIIWNGGGAPRFDNVGTFRKSTSNGTTTFGNVVTFNNYGTVDLQIGTLAFINSFINNGLMTLAAGATNRINGGSASGIFSNAPGSLVEWQNNAYTLSSGAQLNGPGIYRADSFATLNCNTDVSIQNFDLSANLNGGGKVTVNNVLNWTGGSMQGGGTTLIAPGATMNMVSSNGLSLNSRILENAGTTIWTGSNTVSCLSSVITNRAGALFDDQTSGNFTYNGGGACRFDNTGIFRKSIDSNPTAFNSIFNFNNYGTLDIRTGKVFVNGFYTSTANSLLNCALGGATVGTGYSQLQSASTVTLAGGLSVYFTNGFLPMTTNTFTVVSAGTRSGSFATFSYPSNQVTMQLSNTATSVVINVSNVVVPAPMFFPPQLFGTNIILSWTTVPNFKYRAEFNPDLGPSNWNALTADIVAATNTTTAQDPITTSNRYYRIRIVP